MPCIKIIDDKVGILGQTYFEKLLPESCHAVATYSGVGFANTIRMLYFDLMGGQIIVNPELIGIERAVALDEGGLISGVAVSHFIPQFASALDYEKYLIVSADKKEVFLKLLYKFYEDKSKCELITFRSQEQEYLKDENIMRLCRDIHYWELFCITPANCDVPIQKLFDLPRLPKSNTSIETLPERYCAFTNAGLTEYSVWMLQDENEQPLAICSLIPYCQDKKELKLWYCKDAENQSHLIALFLQKVIYLSMGIYGSAIWRVKNPSNIEKDILKAGQFQCIGKEAHYHFDSLNKSGKH